MQLCIFFYTDTKHAYNYLFRLLRITVIYNLEYSRLQIFEGLYTVAQSELLKFVPPDDHLTPLQDLFVRGTAQLQLPKVVESQIWKTSPAWITPKQKVNLIGRRLHISILAEEKHTVARYRTPDQYGFTFLV